MNERKKQIAAMLANPLHPAPWLGVACVWAVPALFPYGWPRVAVIAVLTAHALLPPKAIRWFDVIAALGLLAMLGRELAWLGILS